MSKYCIFKLVLITIALAATVGFVEVNCSPARNEKSINSENNRSTRIVKRQYVDDQEDLLTQDEDMCPQFKDDFAAKSQPIVKPLIQFTSALYSKIRNDESNIILSPLSVHAALNLVALGAEPNSTTLKELRKGLQYPKGANQEQFNLAFKNAIEKFKEISKPCSDKLKHADTSPKSDTKLPIIEFFNTIIAKSSQPFQVEYSNRSKEFFKASVESIDPKRPETIQKICDSTNKWAKEVGFEQEILKPTEFDQDFAGMLLSVVRVQAFWFREFYEIDGKAIFYNFGHKDKSIDGKRLMDHDLSAKLIEFCDNNKASYKSHYEQVLKGTQMSKELKDLNMLAIQIPLQGNVSLTIFEPLNSDEGNGLKMLTEKLIESQSSLANVLEYLDKQEARVVISSFSMPKFGFQSDIDLVGPLKKMGIEKMFNKVGAELNKMIQNEPVYVDKAKHQAMIELNKYGLKAAGVTKIRISPLMAIHYSEPMNIRVDKPFLFLIRYDNIPLFVGQLVKLTGNK